MSRKRTTWVLALAGVGLLGLGARLLSRVERPAQEAGPASQAPSSKLPPSCLEYLARYERCLAQSPVEQRPHRARVLEAQREAFAQTSENLATYEEQRALMSQCTAADGVLDAWCPKAPQPSTAPAEGREQETQP